jgi:hypothetical protein
MYIVARNFNPILINNSGELYVEPLIFTTLAVSG